MYKIYTVTNGESIETIARNLRISPSELRRINGYSPNYEVMVGEQIIVPITTGSYFDTYIVRANDTIFSIAKRYDVSVDDLLALNGLDKEDYIYPNQEILVPRENINFYITKDGDTLASILEILKISLDELYQYNRLVYLVPDQAIIIEKEKN